MRILVTGATGGVGSIVAEELRDGGHEVVGLARSDAAEATLRARGVGVQRGDVADTGALARGARASDGVIHCAFGHDFSRYMEAGETDLAAVKALLGALAGTGKPLVVTSGITAGVVGRPALESDRGQIEGFLAVRGRPEEATLAGAKEGVRAMVVRLPPCVHDVNGQGLASQLVARARETGVSAYVGEGANRWSAVHRRDAARLYRLALERGTPGQRFHAVGEEGVNLKAIAEAIGAALGLPVRSVPPQDAVAALGWVGMAAAGDTLASSAATQASLGWRPTGHGLIEGLSGIYLH